MLLIALVLGCEEKSVVPEGAVFYDITVTATNDLCHDAEAGVAWEQTYTYALAFEGSAVNVYMRAKGDEAAEYQEAAQGITTGCDITYTSPIIGEQLDDGLPVKWTLEGTANYDGGDDGCVDGENDWEGTETFTIVSIDDEEIEDPSVEEGCEYLMETKGVVSSG